MGRPSQQIRLHTWLIGLGLMTALPGCVLLPPYHQPQGFSSTYYRHLQRTVPAQEMMVESPAMPTAPEVPPVTQSSSTGLWNWRR